MSKAPLIAFCGLARSGKDTAANFLVAATGGYRYAFADPIKAMIVPLGIDMSDPYWDAHKEEVIPALGVSPRRILQTLGTDWGRSIINPELWVILAHQRLLRSGPGMVISDLRFENEAAWVRRHGGRVVHITRACCAAVESHVSESGVDILPEDLVISNNGSLEDLQAAVKELFNGYDKA